MQTTFRQVKEIFLGALEKSDPGERQAYLQEACAGDRELQEQVEALLKSNDQAGSFLERPFEEQGTAAYEKSRAVGQGENPHSGDSAAAGEAPGSRVGPDK